jgi:FkbM family methyltransferase
MGLLGWCGVRGFLWRAYCRLFGPGGGILHLELGAWHARFYVHSDWVATGLGSFETGEQRVLECFLSTLKPGDVVYDVGANMGLYAVFLGQVVGAQGQVIAFEPEPHYCERLRSNAALNGLRNVRVCGLALGDRPAELELLPSELGIAPRLAESPPGGHRGRKGYKVRVVEGDRLVEMESLPLPRAVKIDVEGFEYAVLRGLRRTLSNPLCGFVCCEVHARLLPEGVGLGEIRDFLKSCGFIRFDVLPRPPDQHILAFKE